MSDLVCLFFGGFAAGLVPAISFFVIVSAFKYTCECAELAAN